VGPRFEQICREWALASPDVFGEPPGEVGAGIVADSVEDCPSRRVRHGPGRRAEERLITSRRCSALI
jgi:hypothetical protein